MSFGPSTCPSHVRWSVYLSFAPDEGADRGQERGHIRCPPPNGRSSRMDNIAESLHDHVAAVGHAVAAAWGPRWRKLLSGRDRGGATVEFVLAVPLLLLMVLFVIQAGVWMHATHIAQAAAVRALDTARVEGGSTLQGEKAGGDTLTALGSTVLRDPSVSVTRTATQAHVEITGTAAMVVPGVRWPVRATASGPVERFVPEARGFANSEAPAGGN